MKALILYVIRVVLWALKSLWRKYPKPTRSDVLFSRSYMRKAWRDRLRDIDKRFNETQDRFLLMERRVMVAKRRLFRFE